MASKTSSGTGVVYLDTTSAQAALDKLNSKINTYNDELSKANVTAARRLTLEQDRAKAAEKAATVQQQIEKGLGATYNQQVSYLKSLTSQIKNIAVGTEEYKQKLLDLKKAQGVFDEMKKKIRGVQEEEEKLGNGFSRAFTRIAQYAAAYFAFDQVKSFLSDAIDEAEQAEKSTARLHNTLNNLGRSDAFDRITDKANELADTFKFLDNDDITEVFQQLITYGKLTENQMNDLLPVIINFSAKAGISVNEGASVIIKAMEGNAKALKEYGINVKDGSTVTERFGILMSELAPKVAGAADAFGQTFAGQTAIAAQEVANLKEEIGTKMLPILAKFYAAVPPIIDGLKIIFQNTVSFFSGAYDRIKLTLGIAKDLATFNTTAAASRLGSFQAEQEAAKKENEIRKEGLLIQQQVASVARDAATKTLKEQQDILRGSIANRDASMAAWKELTKTSGYSKEEEHRLALQFRQDREEVIALQKVIAQTKDKRTLGGGNPNEDAAADKAAEAARKKTEAEQKRLLEQYNEFVRSLNRAFTGIVSDEGSNKLHKIFNDTAADLEKLKTLSQSDEQFQKGKLLILEKQKAAIHALLVEDGKNAPSKVHIQVLPEITPEDAKKAGESLVRAINNVIKDRKAGLDLDILNAKNHGEERAAKIARLKDDLDDELANKDLTDNQKLVKEKEYQDKVKQINKDSLNEWLGDVAIGLEFASQVTSILERFSQVKTNKENADLKNELKNNDTRKAALKKQLDSKLISQQEYNRQVNALDQAAEAKKDELAKKQFERNKKFQLAQAGISGAQSVLKTIETFGPPLFPNFLGIGAMILTLATIAAEVSAISSAKFAQGGRVDHPGNGKIRVGRNIPVQSNGDDVLATVKRGEVILNERQQAALGGSDTFRSIGVPGFASGGYVRPFWQTRPYRSIDTGRVSHSMQVLRFAEGGRVSAVTTSNGQQGTVGQSDLAVLEALQDQRFVNSVLVEAIGKLNARLDQPLEASVSTRALRNAQALENRINNDSQFK